MPRTPITDQLLRDLLVSSRTDGVAFVHVAALVEHRHAVLLLHGGDGDAFSPTIWQVPTGLLLAPRDVLTDVAHRVVTHTAGLDLDNVTSYLGHHDQHGPGCADLRTIGLTVTVTDPTRMRRNALFGHQWIRLDQTPLPIPAATSAASRYLLQLAANQPTPTPHSRQPPLAADLRAHAHGLHATEAGCELLINHATWLHRNDFRDQFVHTGLSITDATTPMAYIDWAAAIDALDTGRLPCSGGEGRVLRLAASLAQGMPVNLSDAVTGLDHSNIDLVVQAIHHAAGRRRA
ncbi:MAG: hypothetical protein QOE61_1883 [Micromonosporaceae bacterium]|nr:hypothetical protein [Micromonosporaceae bacterium]